MSALALVIVLAAAVGHATWNLLSKQVAGGAGFVWIYISVSVVLFAPAVLAVVLIRPRPFGALGATFVLGSALIHSAYFILLQRSYRVGDLSLIYPLARGSGSMFSAAAAILFFGERPSALAIFGALMVGVGVLLFARGAPGTHSMKSFFFGLLIGVLIALYTLWDKHAVSRIGISPLVMQWGTSLGLAVLLAPAALANREEVRREWTLHRKQAIAIGFLIPFSYILVLTALVFSPVSTIAPAREISILIGAVMGAKVLAEGDAERRLLAATMMVLGLVALAFG